MMDPESGIMRELISQMPGAEKDAQSLKDKLLGLHKEIEANEKDGYKVLFSTGEEVEVKGCLFKIENVIAGNPATLVLIGAPRK